MRGNEGEREGTAASRRPDRACHRVPRAPGVRDRLGGPRPGRRRARHLRPRVGVLVHPRAARRPHRPAHPPQPLRRGARRLRRDLHRPRHRGRLPDPADRRAAQRPGRARARARGHRRPCGEGFPAQSGPARPPHQRRPAHPRAPATILFDLFLVLIIAFLMLLDGDTLWNRFTEMLSEELRSEFELLRMSSDRAFGGFIRGSLILGLIYGIATLLILVAFGVPFSGVLAVFSGIFVMIPFFGPILAMVPVLFITFLGAPGAFVPVLVLSLILQQVMLNVVSPRIMSKSIGIHPLFVFFALLIGSKIAGFWGVLLGVPVAGVINTFIITCCRMS